MCQIADIEVVVVQGYMKGHDYVPGEYGVMCPADTNHLFTYQGVASVVRVSSTIGIV